MYDFKNKDRNLLLKNNYMLTRTISMFDYEGLPETIPEDELEKMLQTTGYAFITEVEGDLYAFNGGLGGEPDVYGNHTEIIVNNPALDLSETYDLKEDGVLLVNDDLKLGLADLFNYYNSLLVENDITMFLDNVNNRMQTLISARDNGTIESAEDYLKKVVDGEVGIIAENAMFEGLTVSNNQKQTSTTTSLIEFQQYIKATLFNEVGLNANFNMKRERLTAGEVEMNAENLYPLVDNMLHVREEGIEKLNEIYNLDVEVNFGSVWAKTDLLDVDESETDETDETIIETDETIIETDDPDETDETDDPDETDETDETDDDPEGVEDDEDEEDDIQ